jgi:hypothetical protein
MTHQEGARSRVPLLLRPALRPTASRTARRRTDPDHAEKEAQEGSLPRLAVPALEDQAASDAADQPDDQHDDGHQNARLSPIGLPFLRPFWNTLQNSFPYVRFVALTVSVTPTISFVDIHWPTIGPRGGAARLSG